MWEVGRGGGVPSHSPQDSPALPSVLSSEQVLGVVHSSGLGDPGAVRWPLVLCLLLAWVVIFLCILKGIHSSGKVSLSELLSVCSGQTPAQGLAVVDPPVEGGSALPLLRALCLRCSPVLPVSDGCQWPSAPFSVGCISLPGGVLYGHFPLPGHRGPDHPGGDPGGLN